MKWNLRWSERDGKKNATDFHGLNGSFLIRVLSVHIRGILRFHSHSIVPGGFDVTSSATRFTPSTSLMMREAMRSTRS